MDSSIAPNREGQLRSANRPEDTTFDRIWKYYYEEKTAIELSGKENDIRERWEFAWNQLCGINTKRQVTKLMSKRFNITTRTAWDDLSNAVALFGVDPRESSKQGKRELASQWLMQAMKICKKKGNMEQFTKLLSEYNKLHGLTDHKDLGIGDIMKKLKPHIIEFSSDPETLKKQAEKLMEDVEDVDFEDMHNG